MRLAEPGWLLALILVLLPWVHLRFRPTIGWPTLEAFAGVPKALAGWARLVPPLLRAVAIGCLVVALARPQTVAGRVRIASEGVVIVVVLDHSSTMSTVDFPSQDGPVTRLEAARRTFAQFVRGRPDDLIGLVAFARLPDTVCPPTLDHGFVLESAAAVTPAGPDEDGSNIGDAVVWGLRDVASSGPPRKVLVLLSDGLNQAPIGGVLGEPVPPIEAAQLADALGVVLHTVAIGSPAREELQAKGNGPDFELLREMATLGRGRMFVATDADALERAFEEIDLLETSRITGTILTRYREWFGPWAAAVVGLLALDQLLAATRLRRLP